MGKSVALQPGKMAFIDKFVRSRHCKLVVSYVHTSIAGTGEKERGGKKEEKKVKKKRKKILDACNMQTKGEEGATVWVIELPF